MRNAYESLISTITFGLCFFFYTAREHELGRRHILDAKLLTCVSTVRNHNLNDLKIPLAGIL